MIKLTSENENVENFLNFIHSQLKKHKMKLLLSVDSIRVGNNSVCGYFSEEEKVIKIDISENGWLDVLVHEFCHFQQFIEFDPTYLTLDYENGNMLNDFWEWIDGNFEFINNRRKNFVIRKILEMELNCEKRSVELIRKYDLPINLDEYIFTAYVYINYYNHVKKYRTWMKDDINLSDLVDIKEVSKNYGGISLEKDFKSLPKEYEELFKKISKTP